MVTATRVLQRCRALVVLGALPVTACITAPETTLDFAKRVPLVHAILDAGTQMQQVELVYANDSTVDPNRYDSTNDPSRIRNASVTITTPDGIVMTATRDSTVIFAGNSIYPPVYAVSAYRYSLDTYGVNLVPGGTYTLRIHTPAGEDIVGTTTVPAATPVSPSAEESFVAARDTLHLDWSPVPGTQSYEVRVSAVFSAPVFLEFRSRSTSIAGTMNDVDSGESIFQPGRKVRVMVSAVDANYYEYYRSQSDPFVGAPPSKLTGGLGVFGSTVPIISRRLAVH